MAINVNDSHELSEDGLSLSNGQGEVTFYITSGTGSPQGSSAPINTWYFQENEQKLWRKNGVGNNDWEEFVAKVAQSIEIEAYEDAAQGSTTSNDWVTKATFTTNTKEIGSYILIHSAQVANSSNNRDTGYRVQWKPNASGTWTTLYEITKEFARGGSFDVFTASSIIDLLSSDEIDVRFQWGQTDSGGNGLIKNITLVLLKAEELN